MPSPSIPMGQRIRELRHQHGLSQRELGERVGVKQQVVANWESGSSNPKLKDLVALAETFSTTTDDLLGRPVEGRPKASVAVVVGEAAQGHPPPSGALGWGRDREQGPVRDLPEELLNAKKPRPWWGGASDASHLVTAVRYIL